jgi:hypothetical protein
MCSGAGVGAGADVAVTSVSGAGATSGTSASDSSTGASWGTAQTPLDYSEQGTELGSTTRLAQLWDSLFQGGNADGVGADSASRAGSRRQSQVPVVHELQDSDAGDSESGAEVEVDRSGSELESEESDEDSASMA